MKSLIVYYSHSGNTRRLAEKISRITGGDLLEIIPETAYPKDYDTVVDQAHKEIRAGFRPALKTEVSGLSACDALFVGTPNWWSSPAPPVSAFLEQAELNGTLVLPFCTHGGGGSGHIRRGLEKLCPRAQVLSELSVYGNTGNEADIQAWLRRVHVNGAEM